MPQPTFAQLNATNAIFTLISNGKSDEAIDQIKKLRDSAKDDDELRDIFHYHREKSNFTLCEWAILQGELGIANEIITLYPNPNIKPLDLGFSYNDAEKYIAVCSFISSATLMDYKEKIKNQREAYCDEISAETKKLRLMAVEKLSELLPNETSQEQQIKKDLDDALSSYLQESLMRDKLDEAIRVAETLLMASYNYILLTQSYPYKEYTAAVNTARVLDDLTGRFKSQQEYSFSLMSLNDFRTSANRILANQSNNILKDNRDFGAILASIGNAISRAIGSLVEGNKFKAREWTIFGKRAKLDNIEETIESVVPPKI